MQRMDPYNADEELDLKPDPARYFFDALKARVKPQKHKNGRLFSNKEIIKIAVGITLAVLVISLYIYSWMV